MTNMNQQESLIDIFQTLWRWRKWIVGICFSSMLITAGLSLLLKNYYRSSTSFYAAHTDLAKPSSIGENDRKMLYYGESEDLNRMMSISKSGEVLDYLIETFNLFEHYDIDPASKHARHKLNLKLNKLFTVTKTKFDAVELAVEDLDPAFATTMVNAARVKINEIGQRIVKSSQSSLLESYKNNIKEKNVELNKLSDTLALLREKYGIYNLLNQSSAYAELIPNVESKYVNAKTKLDQFSASGSLRDSVLKYKIIVAGHKKQLDNLKQKMALFNEGYIPVFNLEKEQKAFTEQLAIDKQRMKSLETAYKAPFNSIHLVEEGKVPDYKSRPRRSIIVLGVGFLMFFLSCASIILLEQFRTSKK